MGKVEWKANKIYVLVLTIVFIALFLFIDLCSIVFYTIQTDGLIFRHVGTYKYEDIFFCDDSKKKDFYRIRKSYFDGSLEENMFCGTLETIGDAQYISVAEPLAIIITTFYMEKNSIGSVGIHYKKDYNEVDWAPNSVFTDKDLMRATNENGYIFQGDLFEFMDELYLFARIKDYDYKYDSKLDLEENMHDSIVRSKNSSVALFRLEGVAINKIKTSDNLRDSSDNLCKDYPTWYRDLKYSPIRIGMVAALLIFEILLSVKIANKAGKIRESSLY